MTFGGRRVTSTHTHTACASETVRPVALVLAPERLLGWCLGRQALVDLPRERRSTLIRERHLALIGGARGVGNLSKKHIK